MPWSAARIRRAGTWLVFAGFASLAACHAILMTWASHVPSLPALLPILGVTGLMILMAWKAFLCGNPGALLGGYAFLFLYSLGIMGLTGLSLRGMDEGPDALARADAVAHETVEYLLSLWMALTAGTVLALRARAEHPPRPERVVHYSVLVFAPPERRRGRC